MNDTTQSNDISRIEKTLARINIRLSAVEAALHLPETDEPHLIEPAFRETVKESNEDLEFRLGEQWFGKIGIIAFLLAVFNFLVLPFESIPQQIILFLGFIISFILIAASFTGAKFLKNLAGYMLGSGLILLFVSTLRLHFFTVAPLLSSRIVLVMLLYIVTGISLAFTLKKVSVYLAFLTLVFLFTAAIISDIPIMIFSTLIIGALGVVYLDKKKNWNVLSVLAILFTYMVHLLWYLGNPIINKNMMAVQDWNLNLLFILAYMIIYGVANAAKSSEESNDFFAMQKTTYNSLGGFGLFLFISLNSNYNIAGSLNLLLSIVLLSLAALHWIKQKSKFSTFLYSMLAYASLSVSIVLTFSSPSYFIWLCWQSLAVVSTALWFRSKFIVVANFVIFLLIIMTYLGSAGNILMSALSFGVVALISARIMNWQKERLELRTDNLRSAYMIVAFLIIPFVLYINLPSQFVGISYIILAFVYYLVGKIINNKKYRMMASGTLILSLIYIFIFGIASSNTIYKIFSFLLVSIALVVISIVYAKVRAKERQMVLK